MLSARDLNAIPLPILDLSTKGQYYTGDDTHTVIPPWGTRAVEVRCTAGAAHVSLTAIPATNPPAADVLDDSYDVRTITVGQKTEFRFVGDGLNTFELELSDTGAASILFFVDQSYVETLPLPTVKTQGSRVWKFEEASGNRVDAKKGVVLAESGGTIDDRTGANGQAADFVAANTAFLTGTFQPDEDFTVMAHCHIDLQADSVLVARWGSTAGDREWQIVYDHTGTQLKLIVRDTAATETEYDFPTTGAIAADTDVFVAAKISNTRLLLRLWDSVGGTPVDGIVQAMPAAMNRPGNEPLTVGALSSGADYLDGYVDGLVIGSGLLPDPLIEAYRTDPSLFA